MVWQEFLEERFELPMMKGERTSELEMMHRMIMMGTVIIKSEIEWIFVAFFLDQAQTFDQFHKSCTN